MARWSDSEAWARAVAGDDCPICRDGGPLHLAAEMETSWLSIPPDGAMRGYCALFLRRHAVELHDLEPDEAAAFMRDARRVSAAVAEAVRPVKMNYEIHGNTLTHFHMHFFPRFAGDPFEGKPIDPRSVPQPVYAPGEFEEVRRRILAALG